MRANRVTPGLRKPGGQHKPPPRAPLPAALQVLRHLRPFAAPRLPDEILACFDQQQRQIRPLPAQQAERARRVTRPCPPGIPTQRRPLPLEHRKEAQRAPRRA